MSRCFGDLALKRPLAVCTAAAELSAVTPLHRDDLFALLVCDGVTDVLSERAIVAAAAGAWPDAAAAARAVSSAALAAGSADNVTCVCVAFGWQTAARGARLLAAHAAQRQAGAGAERVGDGAAAAAAVSAPPQATAAAAVAAAVNLRA
jgi:serine/threonine protein phosphatase PrpC